MMILVADDPRTGRSIFVVSLLGPNLSSAWDLRRDTLTFHPDKIFFVFSKAFIVELCHQGSQFVVRELNPRCRPLQSPMQVIPVLSPLGDVILNVPRAG